MSDEDKKPAIVTTIERIDKTTVAILRSKSQHIEVHIGVICRCPKCEATGEHEGIRLRHSDEDNISFAKAAAFKLLRAQDLEIVGVMEE